MYDGSATRLQLTFSEKWRFLSLPAWHQTGAINSSSFFRFSPAKRQALRHGSEALVQYLRHPCVAAKALRIQKVDTSNMAAISFRVPMPLSTARKHPLYVTL